jgi:hypothetical protein
VVTEQSVDIVSELIARASEQIPRNLLSLVATSQAGIRRRTLADILASDLVSEVSDCFTRDHIRNVIDFFEMRGDVVVADGGLVRRTATYLVTNKLSGYRCRSAILVGSGVNVPEILTIFGRQVDVVTRVVVRDSVPIGVSNVVADISNIDAKNHCIVVDAQDCLKTVPMLYKSFPPIVQVKTRLPELFTEQFVPGRQFEPVSHSSLFSQRDWCLVRGNDHGFNRERRYVLVTPYGNHVDVPRTQVRLIKWWLNWINGRPLPIEAVDCCVIVPADVPNEIHRYLTWMMELYRDGDSCIISPTGYMQSYDLGSSAVARDCVERINELNSLEMR